jgi:hypothetical protein
LESPLQDEPQGRDDRPHLGRGGIQGVAMGTWVGRCMDLCGCVCVCVCVFVCARETNELKIQLPKQLLGG